MYMFQAILDYLKIDIEYSEWDAFNTALSENIFPRVKHLGLEVHTLEVNEGQSTRKHVSLGATSVAPLIEFHL